VKKLRRSAFVLAALCAVLPLSIKRAIYTRIFGWDIARSARIGMAVIWARQVKIGPKASIGHFTVVRNIERLELGENASIGNWIYATAQKPWSRKHFADNDARVPALVLGRHASLTGRHFLDCNDTITIGEFTIVAGRQTIIYTHGINVLRNKQECAPVSIGKYCMLGARCMIVKGAQLPDYSILAAQSVLTGKMSEPYFLYSGNPAEPVRKLDEKAQYFSRNAGYVD